MVGSHTDARFGTHHAKDTYDLLQTIHEHPNIFSSAIKINTQYMHIIRFSLQIKGHATEEAIINKFRENKFTAVTHKTLSNKVFSFGRDHGYYGRIYNHTVVSIPSIYTGQLNGGSLISGYCFTPQDGNSLLSSIAAALYGIYGKEYKTYMSYFDKHLFDEI
jgi:glyceraldehyde-3-phosphate dehydrogenase (NAD(P))